MSSKPPLVIVELASNKKKSPPSDSPPPTSNSPPPSDSSPPPPTDNTTPPPPSDSSSSPPPGQSPPPPPDQSPPPPPDQSSAPPPPDQSPPPPSDQSPPPPTSQAPPPSSPPPPPNAASPPPPPDSTPPPPHQKHSPPPASPPSSTPSPPPPPHSTPPLNSPPPSNTPPPPPTLAPPPSNHSHLPPPPPTNSSRGAPPAASPLPTVSKKKTVSDTPTSNQNSASGSQTVVIGSLVGFLALSLLVLAAWFVSKRKKRQRALDIYRLPSQFSSSSHNSESSFLKPPRPLYESQSGSEFNSTTESPGSGGGGGGIGNSRSWFTYQELIDATDNFSSQNVLGEGGFGCVYKGQLPDGMVVAVKQLKVGSGQGEREFRAEVDIISRIHHRHLVSLVGYCISDRQRLLVYEYISNDTLENHLHSLGRPVLDWANRVRIAIGSAKGLAYLHEDCHPRIIHRDIKSANILLDENFESRVADFGLARLASDTNTHVSTRVMGTFGYMAPEYASSGKLTEKSDVYSFGVVLLELITGRKPVDLSQDESLVEWARPLLIQALETENFKELADPRLENNYVDAEMFRMIEAAGACVRHSASKRPKMGQLVRAFDSMGELADLTNGVKPGQSGIFNTAEQSAQMRMFQRMAFGSQEYSTGFFNETQSSWSSGSGSLASRGPRL